MASDESVLKPLLRRTGSDRVGCPTRAVADRGALVQKTLPGFFVRSQPGNGER